MRATKMVSAALLVGILTLGATQTMAVVRHLPSGTFTRDLKALCGEAGAQLPSLAGSIGLLNMMVWASVGSMAMLVAALWPQKRLWLLTFGSFVLFLSADDAMLLHEEVGPSLGIPEGGFYLLYAIFAAFLLYGSFRGPEALALLSSRRIPSSTVAFVLGGLLLAASVAVDQLVHGAHLAEDAPKLLGAVVWLTVPLLSLPPDIASRISGSVGRP